MVTHLLLIKLVYNALPDIKCFTYELSLHFAHRFFNMSMKLKSGFPKLTQATLVHFEKIAYIVLNNFSTLHNDTGLSKFWKPLGALKWCP